MVGCLVRFGILRVLLSDSRFLLADEGVIHTNGFMILKAWVTVLELARGRLPNLYGPHGGRVFVGFSSFRGFPGLSPYFGLPTRGDQSQQPSGAVERPGNGSGVYQWPGFSTFMVHMVVGFLIGL